MRTLSLTTLLLLPALAAAQQQQVPTTLSLADALVLARENSPTFRQAQNDRTPAQWAARGAWTSLLVPNATVSGSLGYTGPGEQRFLTSSFSQGTATQSSSYSFSLDWMFSGATLSAPGAQQSQLAAAYADIESARRGLELEVATQYLAVIQAVDNERVLARQVDNSREFLRLAQARQQVGQTTMIDVRRAEVALGNAQVLHLRAQSSIVSEKLRLFERIGVEAPADVRGLQLSDSFQVIEPRWELAELLRLAEAENPSLRALRAREKAANWGVKAEGSSFLPTVALSASWGGFTQKFTDIQPVIDGAQFQMGAQYASCQTNDSVRTGAGLPALGCTNYVWNPATDEAAIRSANSDYPFNFTSSPFQARLSVTLPLFTNFSRTQRYSQAKSVEDDLTEAVRARALFIVTGVSEGFLSLQTAYEAVQIQTSNRVASEESLRLATERYRVGSGTFFELLDAQLADLRSEFDHVSSIYDYHRALALLEAAVGRPLR